MVAVIEAAAYKLIEDAHRKAVAAVSPPHADFDAEVWP